MVIGVNNAGGAAAQSDAEFLTSAAAKLGIDGGSVSASFTDTGESFTLKGEVKDKFDYEGASEASTNLEASTSFGDNTTLFASANATSKNAMLLKNILWVLSLPRLMKLLGRRELANLLLRIRMAIRVIKLKAV